MDSPVTTPARRYVENQWFGTGAAGERWFRSSVRCLPGVSVIYAAIVLVVVVAALGGWLALTTRPSGSRGGSANATTDHAPKVEAWATTDVPRVWVANHSSRPVHEVRAFVALGRRRKAACVGWIRTLPPTGDDAAQVALTADSRERWLSWRDGRSDEGHGVAVEVTFRDHTGRLWRRDRSGALSAISN